MICAYSAEIDDKAIFDNLLRIGNQVFKLLPTREENQDWEKPLQTLIVELVGMSKLFSDQKDLLSLVSKMEALKDYSADQDFHIYRKTIFECCGIIDKLKREICP